MKCANFNACRHLLGKYSALHSVTPYTHSFFSVSWNTSKSRWSTEPLQLRNAFPTVHRCSPLHWILYMDLSTICARPRSLQLHVSHVHSHWSLSGLRLRQLSYWLTSLHYARNVRASQCIYCPPHLKKAVSLCEDIEKYLAFTILILLVLLLILILLCMSCHKASERYLFCYASEETLEC